MKVIRSIFKLISRYQYKMLMVTAVLTTFCCCEQKAARNEAKLLLDSEVNKPDKFFRNATKSITNQDYNKAYNSVNNAQYFIMSLAYFEDTLYSDQLDYAIAELEKLKQDISLKSIKNSDEMQPAFRSVNQSLAFYQLSIVQSYFYEGSSDKEGLRRLYRALARVNYAAKYEDYQLTDEEKEELQNLQNFIVNNERSSASLHKRVSQFVNKIDKKLSK